MENKKSIEEIAEIVEMEGLCYAILGYLYPKDIEDLYLAKLWEEATSVLAEIQEVLSPYNTY